MENWRREAILLKIFDELHKKKKSRFSIENILEKLDEAQNRMNFTVYDDIMKDIDGNYHSNKMWRDISFLIADDLIEVDTSNPHIEKVTYWGKTSTEFYDLPQILNEFLTDLLRSDLL